jgi:hypothetical protein
MGILTLLGPVTSIGVSRLITMTSLSRVKCTALILTG